MRNFVVLLFIYLFGTSYSQNLDIRLLKEIHFNRNKKLDNEFIAITNSHSIIPAAILSTMAAYSAIKKDSVKKLHVILIGASLLTTGFFTYSLKLTINRARPYKTYTEIQKLSYGKSPSFPSGHTSEAFSTATSISILYPKWYVITPSFLWASAIGFSRMDLGVHYPSDVLAGAIVGTGSAFLSYWLTNKIIEKRKKHAKIFD